MTEYDAGANRRHVLSQRLRARRRALGLTQQQVVARLDRLGGVSLTNRALSSLERGAGVDVAKLPELAGVLDCSVTYLLGLTDDPRRWRPDAQPRSVVAAPTPRAAVPGARSSPDRTLTDRRTPRTQPAILGPDVPDPSTRILPGA